MNAISPILFFALGIILNIIFIYLSYLIAARKQCSHGSMLKAAAVVAAAAAVVAGLSWWLSEYIPAGCDIIAAVLLIVFGAQLKIIITCRFHPGRPPSGRNNILP